MQVNRYPDQTSPLGLRPGELVQVRSQNEILATLDREGKLDSLPFMPEMLDFCGQTFRVFKRAAKLCDTIESSGMRRMHDTVLLENVRCSGAAHGGCQAGCLTLWKEAWVNRVDARTQNSVSDREEVQHIHQSLAEGEGCTVETLARATRGGSPLEETYSCQATELRRATTGSLSWWDLRQYIRDITSGNSRARDILRGLVILLFNKFQGANNRFLPRLRLIQGGTKYPFIRGSLKRTPKETLDLKPGDLVRVKSKEEILKTLDENNRNRGLSFDVEMLRFCGRSARVLDRVQRIIDERTGQMISISSDCIILEGMFCHADYHQFCPRGTYHYWREIWLERLSSALP